MLLVSHRIPQAFNSLQFHLVVATGKNCRSILRQFNVPQFNRDHSMNTISEFNVYNRSACMMLSASWLLAKKVNSQATIYCHHCESRIYFSSKHCSFSKNFVLKFYVRIFYCFVYLQIQLLPSFICNMFHFRLVKYHCKWIKTCLQLTC